MHASSARTSLRSCPSLGCAWLHAADHVAPPVQILCAQLRRIVGCCLRGAINRATAACRRNAASEDQTHDLRIMGPTRYQLRYSRRCKSIAQHCTSGIPSVAMDWEDGDGQ